MSDLNIQVTGSQLLREVLNCRFTMADISNSRFTPTAEELCHVGHQSCNTIPRGVKERCLAQIAEVLRFRLELKPVISLLGVKCMLDRLLLLVMICATWL